MASQTSSTRVRSKSRASTRTEHVTSPARPSKRTSTTAPTTGAASSVTPDDIAREAYFLWLERGGNEVVNWLEAERRLTDRHGR